MRKRSDPTKIVHRDLAAAVYRVGTMAEVARRAGWSLSMLSAVLLGHRKPREQMALRLADVLGIPLSQVPHWKEVDPRFVGSVAR